MKTFLWGIFSTLLSYLSLAFIKMQLNPSLWRDDDRAIMLVFIAAIFVSRFLKVKQNEN